MKEAHESEKVGSGLALLSNSFKGKLPSDYNRIRGALMPPQFSSVGVQKTRLAFSASIEVIPLRLNGHARSTQIDECSSLIDSLRNGLELSFWSQMRTSCKMSTLGSCRDGSMSALASVR